MTAVVETSARLVANRYALGEVLGAGEKCLVYEATDLWHDHPVAVKLLKECHAGDDSARQRLIREAELLKDIEHRYIVSYLDHGAGNEPYLVMELVQGRLLRDLLGSAMPARRVANIGSQLCDALANLHAYSLIHGDVKPANIMIGQFGDFLTLLDFSVARQRLSPVRRSPDGDIELEGTLMYMSPEAAASKPLGVKSDVFSVGSILYQLLTGQPAFGGRPMLQIALAYQICHSEPPLLGTLDLYYGQLGRIIQTALSKNPADRDSAATMAYLLSTID